MFICMCYNVTDKAIKRAVEEHGVGNLRELRQHLTLGSNCGTCIDAAQQIIDNTIVDETLFKNVG